MYWIDDNGELREGDEEQGQRYGFRPATEEDLRAHNERLDTQAADTKGPAGLVLEGAKRGVGLAIDAPRNIAARLFGDKGDEKSGLVDETPHTSGADVFPEAFSEEARLRTKAHPVYEGLGTGLAAAPVAAGVAAATGGLGLGALGPAIAASTAGTVTEAAAQEYDDAWLEQRPMDLKNVVGYTAMFTLGNVLLGGGAKVAKRAIGGLLGSADKPLALGGRNIVAEATAKAERASGEGSTRAAQSVGAASAKDLAEPFDDAIAQMSDRDAVVMARDADDHLHLAARHSADEWSRISKGLSESLGNHLKYEDVAIHTDALKPKQIRAQSEWVRETVDQALELQEQLTANPKGGIRYGNAGKQIASDLESYSRLLMDEPNPAKRFIVADKFKQTLQQRVMQIGRDFNGDRVARTKLLELLEPLAGGAESKGALLEGLENPKYWGRAGDLQKALNEPWHDMLKHWGKIQEKLLEHTGETQYGVLGAGRNVMQGTSDRMMALFQKDPRALEEIGKQLAGVFDGYQRLIEAREAHGLVSKEGLPELQQSLRNLMEDWNLAHTVGVARNKVKHAQLDPRRWGKVLDLLEKTPLGVGGAIGAARKAADTFTGDLNIQKGTALHEVWDRALQRYAKHPSLGDPSISANYSPWMQDSLRARGAPIQGGPPPAAGGLFGKAAPQPQAPAPAAQAASGGFGEAAAAAAKEHGAKVAGVGLLGASAAMGGDDQNGNGAAAGVGGLGLLLGGKGLARALRPIAEEAAPEALRAAEMMAGRKPAARLWRSAADATGMRTFADGLASKYHTAEAFDETAQRVVKELSPEHRRALENWTTSGYKNLQAGENGEASKATLDALNDAVAKGLTTPGEVTRGVWLTPEELERFKSDPVFVSPGFMGTSANRNYPRQFLANKAAESQAGKVPVIFQIHQVSGVPLPFQSRESEVLLRPGTAFDARVVRDEVRKGVYEDTVHLFERDAPTSAPTSVAPLAGGLLVGLAGIAAADTAHAAGSVELTDPEPVAPAPEQGPVGAYRDAMRAVNQGGEAVIRRQASAALRGSPPKGRSALRVFTGRRDLDGAVDAAREAIASLQGDPEGLVDMLAGSTGELGTTHPAVYMALVQKAHAIVGYLGPKVPQRTGKTLIDPEGMPPSYDRSVDFAHQVVGALMPTQAMSDIARLDAAPEETASFQENWPELWEPLRAELLGQVQRRYEAGRPVDGEKLRALDELLQMDGQLDPSASTAVAQQLLAAQEQAPAGGAQQSPAGKGLSGKASSSFQTRLAGAQAEQAIG